MVTGEWWLMDGRAVAADGDVGDKNHDMHVWTQLLSEFEGALDTLPLLRDVQGEIREWMEQDTGDTGMLRELLLNSTDALYKERRITEVQFDDCYAWIQASIGWDAVKFDVLLANDVDAKRWAIEHWGWVRVHGAACECWQLNKPTRKLLADGLYDAYDEDALGAKYLVEVWHPTHRVFRDVPFESLERGTAILACRERGT